MDGLLQIKEYVLQMLEEDEFAGCFLVDIQLKAKKLEVIIDSDEGISFSECKKMSRRIESWLDSDLILGEDYVLEVSSPGVDRPLRLLRQFPKHIGRSLSMEMKDGTIYEGVLRAIKGETLQMEHQEKKNKVERTIDFKDIDKAFVMISFKAK